MKKLLLLLLLLIATGFLVKSQTYVITNVAGALNIQNSNGFIWSTTNPVTITSPYTDPSNYVINVRNQDFSITMPTSSITSIGGSAPSATQTGIINQISAISPGILMSKLKNNARMVVIGTSITSHGWNVGTNTNGYFDQGAWVWANTLAGSNLTMPVGGMLGVAGSTTFQMVGRLKTLIDLAPEIVFVEGGTNDLSGTSSAIITNLQIIVNTCKAINAKVIITKILPRYSGFALTGPQEATRQAVNAWIGTLADNQYVYVIDAESIMTSNMFVDGLHPNNLGAFTWGSLMAQTLVNLVNPNKITDNISVANSLNTNPLMRGTGGSLSGATGVSANSWNLSTTSAGGVNAVGSQYTTTTDTAMVITVSGTVTGTTKYVTLSEFKPTTIVNVGDKLEGILDYEIIGTPVGINSIYILSAAYNSGNSTSYSFSSSLQTADYTLPFPQGAGRYQQRTPISVMPFIQGTSIGSIRTQLYITLVDNAPTVSLTVRIWRAGTRKVQTEPVQHENASLNNATLTGVSTFSAMAFTRTTVADVAYTIVPTDKDIIYTSLTATRAVTLPAASTVPNQEFLIKDESGLAGTYPVTIIGTVDGGVNPTVINTNYGIYKLYSNGTSWFSKSALDLLVPSVQFTSVSQTIDYFNNIRPEYTPVAETKIRKANTYINYTGTVRMVGTAQTYTTISAAYAACSSGDIIQLIDGTYLTSAESGGYLLLNDNTKSVLIRGNVTNPAAVIIQQNASATYGVRIRQSNNITFQDLTITDNQTNGAVIINTGLGGNPINVMFDNCILTSTAASGPVVSFADVANTTNYFEFRNCVINGNTASSAFMINNLPTDAAYVSTPQTYMITGCTINGFTDWGDASANFIMYDSQLTESAVSAAHIWSWGIDITPAPTTSKSNLDIRGCNFKFTNRYSGHCVLLGKGTKNVYMVNCVGNVPSSATGLGDGLVIKSSAVTKGDVTILGCNFIAPRPCIMKGCSNVLLKYSTFYTNAMVGQGGYGVEFNNPNDADGPISTTGNEVSFNTFTAKTSVFFFNTNAGASNTLTTVNTGGVINYNRYKVYSGGYYINNDGTTVQIAGKAGLWGQDVNSTFVNQ